VIVGSGPAGLSAAARAAARELSHVLLEKADHLSDTIYKYQRGKYIMATPDRLLLRSDISFQASQREAILQAWDEQVRARDVNVRLNADVVSISGSRGDFTIGLAGGDTVRADAVILACGTAGNPNKLRVPGAELPFVQYQLDDPREYFDEHIIVIGGGDAGIENALGLAADPDQNNMVTILQNGPDFARAKPANVQAMTQAKGNGRLDFLTEASTVSIEPGWITVATRTGEARLECNRVIARIGASPPRKFVESCGVEFTGPDREAFPKLSPSFESTVPGLYVVGALAGYPLIKHCMNQGYDAVEHIAGNTTLKPADEPLLQAIFEDLPGARDVDEWLEFLRVNIEIFRSLSPLQMREFMLDSDVHYKRKGQVIFERNDIGSSLFAIAEGQVNVEIAGVKGGLPLSAGTIFGEIGLISGRRRSATVRASQPSILVELSRGAARKLIASVPSVKLTVDRIATERMLKQVFGPRMTDGRIAALLENAELVTVPAGGTVLTEGAEGYDIYVLRFGSLTVSRQIGGREVFLSYLPAGAYVGEMAYFENGVRNATVRAAVRSELVRIPGDAFAALMEDEELRAQVMAQTVARRRVNDYVEGAKAGFGSAVDMYSSVANFLVREGLGEATDALLIDERICIGCDNCEVACAEIHEGISRLDREAGATYAYLHVPTSCRHCEHPHCMSDCPPDAIHRSPDGEVYIDDSCIGCGNCQRNCPYSVIQMEKAPPEKAGLLNWLFFGAGPGPGQPIAEWTERKLQDSKKNTSAAKLAVKCDMCKGVSGGAACVKACPTGAAIRVSPEEYLTVARYTGS
jgi:Fe-S-cluster-containing hydrogenase component 2/thioredoxin reductase/CRP-like cAMP-binding protein